MTGESAPHGVTARQVGRQRLVGGAQASEVDDSLNPSVLRRTSEIVSVSLFLGNPVGAIPDGVNEIHGNVDASHCVAQVVSD
jgi:hypothetical protein